MKYQEIKSIANSSRAGFYEELNNNNGVDVKRYLELEEFFKVVKMSHRKLSIAEDNFNECKKNMRVFCLSCGTYKDLVEGDVFCISCDLEKK